MPMSRKHYIVIADALNKTMWDKNSDPATVTDLMMRLAGEFRVDNPMFDSKRFYEACTRNPLDAK